MPPDTELALDKTGRPNPQVGRGRGGGTGGGRPKGMTGTPVTRRAAARLEHDFPDYAPLSAMAEGAIKLRDLARAQDRDRDPQTGLLPRDRRDERSIWPDAVAASEKVAAFIMAKPKQFDMAADDKRGKAFVIYQIEGDAEL